jgi:ATP-dependent 26S proteasome regulatory subunit
MREVALEVPKVRRIHTCYGSWHDCVAKCALLNHQVTWADVGGNEAIKQQLREAVEWPFHSAEALSRLGAVAPKGEYTLM